MEDPKLRKYKEKPKKEIPQYESKPRIDKSNTPHGHSDKIRQSEQS